MALQVNNAPPAQIADPSPKWLQDLKTIRQPGAVKWTLLAVRETLIVLSELVNLIPFFKTQKGLMFAKLLRSANEVVGRGVIDAMYLFVGQ